MGENRVIGSSFFGGGVATLLREGGWDEPMTDPNSCYWEKSGFTTNHKFF